MTGQRKYVISRRTWTAGHLVSHGTLMKMPSITSWDRYVLVMTSPDAWWWVILQLCMTHWALGLITPIAVRGKILFQEATRLKFDWDVPVPEDLATRWRAWLRSLQNLHSLHFPRCVIPHAVADGAFLLWCESMCVRSMRVYQDNQCDRPDTRGLAGKLRTSSADQTSQYSQVGVDRMPWGGQTRRVDSSRGRHRFDCI